MPTERIALVGTQNTRGNPTFTQMVTNAKDQRFINVLFSPAINSVSGRNTVYAEKRQGFDDSNDDDLVDVGTHRQFYVPQGASANYGAPEMPDWYAAAGSSSSCGVTAKTSDFAERSLGSTVGPAIGFSETNISFSPVYTESTGIPIGCVVLTTGTSNTAYGGQSKAYYHPCDSKNYVGTWGGNRTSGSPIITNLINVRGSLYSGQPISGTGIPADTYIVSYDFAGTSLTMSANATSGSGTLTTLTIGDLARIVDADYPISYAVGRMIFLDGYAFVMTLAGRIYNSALNDLRSWGAADYISVDTIPDSGVGLAKYKNIIVAFGESSVEFFRNAGNATGSPLSRIPDATLAVGASNTSAIAEIDGTVYWVGTSAQGGFGVFRLNGMKEERISTPVVEAYLRYGSSFRVVGSWMSGSRVVYVLIEGNSVGLQLNLGVGLWSEVDFGSTLGGIVGAGQRPGENQIYSLFTTSNKILRTSEPSPVFQDDGSAYTATIQTSLIDHGTDGRKFIDAVRLIADTQSSGTATLLASDNNYQSFRTLGTFDMTKQEKRVIRCGSYKGGRSYRITHAANTAFRAQAIEIDYSVAP